VAGLRRRGFVKRVASQSVMVQPICWHGTISSVLAQAAARDSKAGHGLALPEVLSGCYKHLELERPRA
jgi:hypothetical protein